MKVVNEWKKEVTGGENYIYQLEDETLVLERYREGSWQLTDGTPEVEIIEEVPGDYNKKDNFFIDRETEALIKSVL